jgi:hypothetical protein
MRFSDGDPAIRPWSAHSARLGAMCGSVVRACNCAPYRLYIQHVLRLYPQLEFALAEVSSVSFSCVVFLLFLCMYNSFCPRLSLGSYYTYELEFALAEFFLSTSVFSPSTSTHRRFHPTSGYEPQRDSAHPLIRLSPAYFFFWHTTRSITLIAG